MNNIEVTSAQYCEHEGRVVCIKAVIDEQILMIPLDPANRHYAEIMRQVEAGELTIQEADS